MRPLTWSFPPRFLAVRQSSPGSPIPSAWAPLYLGALNLQCQSATRHVSHRAYPPSAPRIGQRHPAKIGVLRLRVIGAISSGRFWRMICRVFPHRGEIAGLLYHAISQQHGKIGVPPVVGATSDLLDFSGNFWAQVMRRRVRNLDFPESEGNSRSTPPGCLRGWYPGVEESPGPLYREMPNV